MSKHSMEESVHSLRILKKIIKYAFYCVIFAVIGVLIVRIVSSGDPAEVKAFTYNQVLADAYQNESLVNAYYQDQSTITKGENNRGYFSVTDAKYFEKAMQYQVVFRYNKTTLNHLTEDYGLTEIDSDTQYYDCTLVLTQKDVTSENRVQPITANRFEKGNYVYYRYVFDDVVIDETVEGVFFDIYYNGAVDYAKEAYGTLCLYDGTEAWLTYSLTKKEVQHIKYGE